MAERAPSDYAPHGRPFTGRKMLLTILAFFGVIIAANGALTYFALTNFHGVVVDSGYVASQHFNETRAAAEAQAARGWAVSVADEGGAPVLTLLGPDGVAPPGLEVHAKALRTLDARLDRALTLRETAPGVWTADQRLSHGQWRIALTATGFGEPYRVSLPLVVAP
ncbi:FixH family protein [Rubrimonas cliftonensis]|uniref:Nitrogen fixation protein FixH n=1 Tax=Rubrimonas cliftonensis TaxID=89524 RepID=A0A1H4DNB1_9RHOB|nr:FixH family protein [Rubrimonas cliftonensis]SEA73999.1 Nitrogen fixation protein FixH [Rubrimonas cliftonensis]